MRTKKAIGELLRHRALPVYRLYRRYRCWVVARKVRKINEIILRQFKFTVQDGPFKGLKYLDQYVCGCLAPKLIGCYEEEIMPTMESLLHTRYDLVINIGCGEGYYAVGIAQRMPWAKIVAYDTNLKARELCAQLGQLNQVSDRLTIRGLCDHGELNRVLIPKSLLVVDCEGAEKLLLDPVKVPLLAQTDILVELHDFVDPTISSALRSRFSHRRVSLIRSREREPSCYPSISFLKPRDQFWALREFRPGTMEWACIQN
jgi:hypothetical protein